ncbi:MAG: zf-HC2 domain-containing protein [Acidobacteria bacterium]|nr:zf-HC2 domain-containing protein [Acidobacteriota bacterium]
MNTSSCPNEDLSGLLPLYAAGTLAAGERARVDTHVLSCTYCQAELQILRQMAEAFDEHGAELVSDHLAAPQLVAYSQARHGLDRDVVKAVESHLNVCFSCSQELAMLQEVDHALAEEEAGTTSAAAPAGFLARFKNLGSKFRFPISAPALGFAAGLVILALLVGRYFIPHGKLDHPIAQPTTVQPTTKTLEQPPPQLAQAMIPSFTLVGETAVRGSQAPAKLNRITLTRRDSNFSVSFFIEITSDPAIAYALAVLDGQNQVVLERQDIISQDRFGNFEQVFEAKLFRPGRHRLLVKEAIRDSGKVVQTFVFPLEIILE